MLAPARRDRGLLRHQRREILIADLRRREDEDQNGETEGGDLRPLRPVTQRNHTHTHATLRDTHWER